MIPRNTIVVTDNMIKELYQEQAKFEKELEEYSSWSRTLKDANNPITKFKLMISKRNYLVYKK